MEQAIILTKQKHDAKRAGPHMDWRMVVGDKAFSWATKKPEPEVGGKLLLWEQPVHTAAYALSKKIIIPDGQYGAGVTKLVYAQKGVAKVDDGSVHMALNNGDSYFLKSSPKYGSGAWLLVKTAAEVSNDQDLAKLIRALLVTRPIRGSSAMRAYEGLEREGLLHQKALNKIREDKLAKIMKENGYGRFDLKTAKILKELPKEFPFQLPRKHIGSKTLANYSRTS